jgi:hypothetical protein
MSTFFLLPPRPELGQRFATFLSTWFPGLDWHGVGWADLAETLAAVAGSHPDVFVVYREDLPEGEDTSRALADSFGAEDGDVVVEVVTGAAGMAARRWQLRAA